MEKRSMKVIVMGDPGVGRTSLLKTYTLGHWPSPEELEGSSVFDNYSAIVNFEAGEIEGRDEAQTVEFQFWDVSGAEEYASLRVLNYPQTDVFIICFSLAAPESLKHVKTTWVPEVSEHCPGAPFMLVGTNRDLRDKANKEKAKDKEVVLKGKKLDKKKGKKEEDEVVVGDTGFVESDAGDKMLHEMGGVKYLECSALTQEGLREVFRGVCEVHEISTNPLLGGSTGVALSKKEKKALEKQEKLRRKSIAQTRKRR